MADLPLIRAYAHGGHFAAGQPHLIVIHSTEGPMSRGNAKALAGPAWFGGSKAGTSAHDIYDPSGGVRMLGDDTIAWHCGPGGNGKGTGSEHCGRVSLTRAQWLSADGQAMLDASAQENAARAKRLGIPPRWLSLTQLRAGQAGFCTHNDIRLVFGGTTHSDPGLNFPYDWYIARVQHYYNGGSTPAAPKPQEEDVPLTAADGQTVWNTRVEVPKAQAKAFAQPAYSAEQMLFGANYWAGQAAKGVVAIQAALVTVTRLLADGNTVQPDELEAALNKAIAPVLAALNTDTTPGA